ncbi:MAG: dihydrolipoyl dehydrogenase [Dehalococcoidales bacterium]|nr:dihydrolipoyl dehydrogenase [Dehalococcoidales bacterium]
MEERNLLIIGGGPAGYIAAIRAAQLGGKITLVEYDTLGGTCLNRGCVPSKCLLHSVELYQSMQEAGQYGINATGVNIDLAKMMARKNAVISTHVSGVQNLLKANKIEVIKGRAELTPSRQVAIDDGQGQKQIIQAQKIILATGAKPITLPIPGADSPSGIIDAESVLNLDYIPKSLLMIGGGVIGVEMTTILAKLGCQVSIVEMLPHILPLEDAELTAILSKALKDDGVQVYEGTKVSQIEDAGNGKTVTISDGEGEKKLEVEVVAIAVGYRPNTDGIGLEETGVTSDKGAIQVNEHLETDAPDIYAAGDVIGGMMLAYVAMEEGIVAAENALGRNLTIDYQAVPKCTFSLPELASVGLTSAEAVAQEYQIQVGRFPFAANSMATILGERRGLVKIVTELKYGQILGVHIIGPRATDLIAEATLAMKLEVTPHDIVTTLHSHPSLSEALHEATLDITGETRHYPSQNRPAT